jgi:hypothetical protein
MTRRIRGANGPAVGVLIKGPQSDECRAVMARHDEHLDLEFGCSFQVRPVGSQLCPADHLTTNAGIYPTSGTKSARIKRITPAVSNPTLIELGWRLLCLRNCGGWLAGIE